MDDRHGSIERIDRMLDTLYGEVKNVKTGSEEFSRLMEAIERLENAKTKYVEAMTEAATKEVQSKVDWFDRGIKIAMAIAPFAAMGLQRKTNMDLLIFERDGVIPHAGFDNSLRFLNIFRK